jgi:DtxR family transcriptional regulator, Mn-dependent transcriptional regulator
MADPGLALALFALLVLVLALVCWPRTGLVARARRLLQMSERVRLEDALKHLYDCETRGVTCTLQSLAGALETRRGSAIRILSRLQTLGLAQAGGEGHMLTDEGRSYALRILRTHRLVERYLADRTGMLPRDWHTEAEHIEHRLTEAETERLARRMGHPVYDPHGDPIPTAAGAMPAAHGQSLGSIPAGTAVRIIHLEDEPPEAFQRLVEAGFQLGQTLRVLDVLPERIQFTSGGKESSLASVLAANVTVEPIAEEPEHANGATLADLEVGESAVVSGISPLCQGPQRRRLLDLGVVPGTEIRARMRSAAGDPIAYEIRGALIGLRRQQAEWIRVRSERHAEGAAA